MTYTYVAATSGVSLLFEGMAHRRDHLFGSLTGGDEAQSLPT
jgi:hypothetical protein